MVALWRPPQVWPVALQREAFKPPARLRLPMPGLVFVCSPGRAPWVYAALERPVDYRAASLPDARLQRLPGRTGLPRQPQASPRRSDSYRSPSSSPTSLAPETHGSGPRSTPTTCTRYGRSSMERLNTRPRTLFPSARWPRSSQHPRGDGSMATASGAIAPRPLALKPVGYLVNHPDGLSGSHGIGYDYVLGAGGLYVQSESADLTARVLVSSLRSAGAGPRGSRRWGLRQGPIPAGHIRSWVCAGSRATPDTERFFAIRWEGQLPTGWWRLHAGWGRPRRLKYRPPAGAVAEFHSHGSSRAFFSETDDSDEQGFRIYGVAGRLDSDRPELKPTGRRLRPLRTAEVVAGVRRPATRHTAGGRGSGWYQSDRRR